METASSIDKKRPDRRGVLCSVVGEMCCQYWFTLKFLQTTY